jgi:hypothetical protein
MMEAVQKHVIDISHVTSSLKNCSVQLNNTWIKKLKFPLVIMKTIGNADSSHIQQF